LIDGALQPLTHRLTQRRLRMRRAPWPESVPLEADPALLEQALHGLLNNAVEASPVDGELILGVHVESDAIEIRLEDSGPGLPFEPEPDGLRPGPTTKRFGTGLGIPFAFKVVEAHGGRLVFDPRPGGGTRVRLRLPRRPEVATIAS
jgi:signal transduction histidine kinase